MPKTNGAQNNSPNINETRKNPPSKMGATTSNRFCAQVLAKQSPNNACNSSTTFSPLKIWQPAKNDKAIGNDIFWGPKTPIRALKMQVQIPSVQSHRAALTFPSLKIFVFPSTFPEIYLQKRL